MVFIVYRLKLQVWCFICFTTQYRLVSINRYPWLTHFTHYSLLSTWKICFWGLLQKMDALPPSKNVGWGF